MYHFTGGVLMKSKFLFTDASYNFDCKEVSFALIATVFRCHHQPESKLI